MTLSLLRSASLSNIPMAMQNRMSNQCWLRVGHASSVNSCKLKARVWCVSLEWNQVMLAGSGSIELTTSKLSDRLVGSFSPSAPLSRFSAVVNCGQLGTSAHEVTVCKIKWFFQQLLRKQIFTTTDELSRKSFFDTGFLEATIIVIAATTPRSTTKVEFLKAMNDICTAKWYNSIWKVYLTVIQITW